TRQQDMQPPFKCRFGYRVCTARVARPPRRIAVYLRIEPGPDQERRCEYSGRRLLPFSFVISFVTCTTGRSSAHCTTGGIWVHITNIFTFDVSYSEGNTSCAGPAVISCK